MKRNSRQLFDGGLIHTLTKGRRVLLTIEKLLNKLCLKEFLQRGK